MAPHYVSLVAVLFLTVATASCNARSVPSLKEITLEAASPYALDAAAPLLDNSDSMEADMAEMTCSQAEAYASDFHRKFASMPLDLERVCVSLRTAMRGGMTKCPGFKPTGTFAKLFRVCKVVTNAGTLTCTSAADCMGGAGVAVSL